MWAFFVAAPISVLLIVSANRTIARVSAAVYVTGVLLVYGTSAAYHRIDHSDRARQVMRLLDHSMIFILIAATYTPICLLGLPRSWAVPVLVVVWAGALGGVLLKVVAFHRFQWLGYALYPILSLAMIVILPVLAERITALQLFLVVAGVVAYALGALMLKAKRPDPWPSTFGYHEVWHVCTVIAGCCHFAAVGLLVR